MEQDIFGEKSKKIQRPRTDRFVAPRSSLADLSRRHLFSEEVIDFWDPEQAKRIKYISRLNEAMGIQQPKSQSSHKSYDTMQVWPCQPRKKTYLASTDRMLELPTYNNLMYIIDWSSNDVLVFALDSDYFQCSLATRTLIGTGDTLSPVNCCKFDPRGELLALGTISHVELHDHALMKRLTLSSCICSINCYTTALDWSPTGNSFVAGCSNGTIRGCTRSNIYLDTYKYCDRIIHAVKISPNASYVAVLSVASHRVQVLTWPTLQPYYHLDSKWKITTVTWHPWSSALLSIATGSSRLQASDTEIWLWDFPPNKIRRACVVPSRYSVDTLLFSQRSGEMVLSLWNEDLGSRVVVLGNPDTIVDQCAEDDLDRIRTMVFSPDGTKLALATTEEDLVFWNFLPEDKKKKNKSSIQRFSAHPFYLDQAVFGRSLR